MPLFRRGLPRRAVVGAFIGFLYGALYALSASVTGDSVALFTGLGWGLLSISLLFARSFSYYVWVVWALLWIAWKGVQMFRTPSGGLLVDVLVPLVALALLSSSGYLVHVQDIKDDGSS